MTPTFSFTHTAPLGNVNERSGQQCMCRSSFNCKLLFFFFRTNVFCNLGPFHSYYSASFSVETDRGVKEVGSLSKSVLFCLFKKKLSKYLGNKALSKVTAESSTCWHVNVGVTECCYEIKLLKNYQTLCSYLQYIQKISTSAGCVKNHAYTTIQPLSWWLLLSIFYLAFDWFRFGMSTTAGTITKCW